MPKSTSLVRLFLHDQCKLLVIALLVVLATSPLIGDPNIFAETDHIAIEPSDPTEGDEVLITISGEWRNSCPSVSYSSTIFGNTISFQVTLESKSAICAPVVTHWSFTENVGKLPAGTYRVEVEATDIETGVWGFHDSTTFDVSPTHRIYLPFLTKNYPALEHEAVELINRERVQRGLSAFSNSAYITTTGRPTWLLPGEGN